MKNKVHDYFGSFHMNKLYRFCIFLLLFFCAHAMYAHTTYVQIAYARTPTPDSADEGFNFGTVFNAKKGANIRLPSGSYTSYTSEGIPVELIAPNALGNGFVSIPIEQEYNPSPAYLDAQELRLKVRELTSQLLETWSFSGLEGLVAYVTTFTPQHDLTLPTPFGQTVRDAFIYEFNNRGFPVRDFSARDLIISEDGFGFGVSNNTYKTPVVSKNTAIVTGTFYRDKEYLFLNVRLVRGYDGIVLRTAQTIFPITPLIARMTDRSYRPKPSKPPKSSILLPISSGGLPIVAGKPIP